MANSPKTKTISKTKAPASAAKKPAPRSSKTPASRTRATLADPAQNYVVLGTVTYPDGKPAAGLTVIAYDKDESGKDMLGKPAVAAETGGFSIPYSEADFRKTEKERGGADVIVCVYDANQELLFTSKRKNNASAEFELKITVPAEQYVVRGKVTDANQRPLANMLIRAYERDLRHPQLLGDDISREAGEFRIAYSLADFQLADVPARRAPWLIVEVRASSDGEVLARQEVKTADRDQTISFTLASGGLVPVKQQIDEAVFPLLQGQGAPRVELGSFVGTSAAANDLAPWDITPADVDFIVRETGLDSAAVHDWARSARLWNDARALQPKDASAADRSALQVHGWPFFFGWCRAGLAPGLVGVLSAEPALWAVSLRVAHARGWCSPLSEPEAKDLQSALEQLAAIASLDPVYAGDPMVAAIGAMPTGLPPGVAVKALNLYREKGLQGLADFGELGGGDPVLGLGLATLAKTLRVYDLTNGNAGLIQPLVQRLDGAAEGLEPLATMGSSEWSTLVQEAGFDEAGARDMAAILQLKVEQLYPTPALLARVATGDLVFEGHESGVLGVILGSNIEAVDTLLRGGDLDASDGFVAKYPELVDQIRDLGRWVKAGAGFAVAPDLIKLGFKSPGVLTNYGPTVIEIILPDLPPAIRDVIAGHQGRFRRDLETLLNTQPDLLRPPANLPPGRPPTPQIDPVPPPVAGISAPTVRGMFGDLDDCICRPCESVLGQGAYLVDLLNLLKREVLKRGTTGSSVQTGIDLLRARRPEIFDLEVSCDNAEVLLPHVDLALEALEWRACSAQLVFDGAAARPIADWFRPALDTNLLALIQQSSAKPIGAVVQATVETSNPRLWRITDGLRIWLIDAQPLTGNPTQARTFRLIGLSIRRTEATPDPRVEPVHRNPMAYDTLRTAVFPWTLPFDLASAESRQFLERLKLSRLSLMALCSATTGVARVNEILGLTTTERGLLEVPRTGDPLWQAWGFANAGPITVVDPSSAEALVNQTPQQLLQRASILLARSALELADLEAVLATRFVGGFALTERSQCKTSLMRVAPSMAPEALDRLHRFVRLWKKLPGWTIAFLDSALAALNPIPAPTVQAMDGDVLAGIAAVQEAQSPLGLSNEALLGLRAPLSSVIVQTGSGLETVSLFANVFLSNRVGTAARDLFARVAIPGTSLTAKISDNLDALAAALSEKGPAIAQMVPMIPTALGDVISHETLTWLSRHVGLARALGVSVLELRLLIELTGLDPLGAAVPPASASSADRAAGFAAVTAFTKAASKINESGLSILLLADALLPESHVMRREMQRPDALKSIDQITSDLAALRKALRETETPAEADVDSLARQVRVALSRAMDSETAQQVIAVFGEPLAVADPVLVAALSNQAIADQDPFGIGLLTSAQANDLLVTPLNQLSLRVRLTQALAAVGAQTRRLVLAQSLESWTGLSGAALNSVVQDGLMVDPATSGGAPRTAYSVLTHQDFWSAADATAIDTAVVTWAKRLDRLLAILKGVDPALALRALAGRAWHVLILPSAGSTGVARWQTLAPILDTRWLAQPTQVCESTLRDHLDALAAPGAANDLPTATGPLAQRLGLEPAEILVMAAQTTGVVATAASLRDPAVLRRVTELATLSRPLRATAGQLAALAGTDAAQIARTARQLLAARAGAENWPAILTGVSDSLRKQQRDALVAYLLQTTPGFTDANGLYEQLLIDPQIQPCFMTTRITQAVASVQLLIQRMLFGLEPDALVSEVLRERWTWMRSYRLWEANRKVFLYPENWLFPELRDDKSTSFRRLEATLGQGELNQERAGQAFDQFLDDINQVAQTQVLGLFEDVDAGQQRTRRDLVMVGRSPNPPYFYYWRRCQEFGKRWMEWSPWERIELDIQGDHVMPFVHNGRVHVAWPIFHQQAGSGSQAADKWRVELAWSQFDGTAWCQVNSSRDNAPPLDRAAFEDERSGFAFRPYIPASGPYPTIYAYRKDAAANTTLSVEAAPPVTHPDISAPAGLYELSGVGKLADLLFGKVSELGQDYRDILEFYCVRTNSNAPVGYTLISINDVLLNPAKLAWHRGERGSVFTKPIVDSLTYTRQEIEAFIRDFRLYGYGTGSIYASGSWTVNPYVGLIYAIIANCSSRSLRYRVWVRLPSSSNDLLELQPADGTFTLQVSGQSQAIALRPGQLSEPMIKAGDTPGGSGHSATLTWAPPSGSTPLSATLDLEPVGKGRSVIQTLHFEIRDLTNSSGFTSRLQTQRSFKQVQRFTLQPTGAMATQVGDGSSLELLDGSSDVWMNGLREMGTSGQTFGLTLRKAWNASIPVFGVSDARDRYWVVGASVPGASTLPQTNLWHFKELASACLIDVSPDPSGDVSGSGISVYPTAWPKGDSVAKAWHETGRLPSGSDQADDFGAVGLPALSSGMQAAMPSAIRQGRWVFDNRLPNACYNWEVFFHAPLLIADHLSKQQRFEDAERWLRMVFDPTTVEPGRPQSFLRFRVFSEMPRNQSVAADLKTLAKAVASSSSTPYVESIKALITRWRSQPYRPFVIARRRHVAFLWRTLFAYLDNLLAWADSLYRRDTREAIGEAAQLYVLAARILGPKPRLSEARRSQAASSYTDLAQKWDDFANAWVDATTPASTQPPPTSGVPATNQTPAPEGFLFFCIPVNDKLSTYWDLVNERLFNIRHCRNFDGIARDLPLTDPPIDPELLVRATAAGLDINDVVNDLFAQPLPYRYSVLVARALDLASDVRVFGSALLSAMEKRDSEQLAQLRSTNEIDLLKRVTEVRKLQIEEAQRNLDALRASRAGTAARYEQIQRQLGKADKQAPVEQETIGEESQLGRLASGSTVQTSNWGLIAEEQRQLEGQSTAGFWTDAESVARIVGGAFSLSASIAHLASSVIPTKVGESLSALASAGGATADAFRAISQIHQTEASRQATSAGHIRRRDEWAYQSNQVLRELRQIDKQVLANEIRIALTKAEMQNHETQIEQSEAIDSYLHEKFTNAELYDWMASQLTNLHSAAYRMSLDMARHAERAAAHELGVPALNVIRSDYWNGRRSSLLAGERMQQDIKRLEIAYLKQNRREYELTKHVSLLRLNPIALLALKAKGVCEFQVPEWLFDMETPGHYMRRIKTVSLSIPCVLGPYASVNCKLTLLRNSVRHSQTSTGSYAQAAAGDDPRFTVRYGASESIVTSTGHDDSGLFETALHDERYLPFEGAGAISRWRLELPRKTPQFDFDTISDVILHVRYTARDGGDGLRTGAEAQWVPELPASRPIVRYPLVLSCRNDFSSEWKTAKASAGSLRIKLDSGLLPYWMTALTLTIRKVSTLTWPAGDPPNLQPVERWPQAALPLTLGASGTGIADLGVIAQGLDDMFIVLEVGNG